MSQQQQPSVLRTEVLDAARLAQLASEPGKMVYEFKYDTPEGSMTPAQQVSEIESIIANFDALQERFGTESTEALRERVLALSGATRQHRLFQRLYPRSFALITQRVYDASDVERLDKLRKGLLFAAKNKEAAAPDMSPEELEAGVMQTLTRLAMHPATAADAATAQRVPMQGDGLPDVDGAERIPETQPLDRMELGESLVRQRLPE